MRRLVTALIVLLVLAVGGTILGRVSRDQPEATTTAATRPPTTNRIGDDTAAIVGQPSLDIEDALDAAIIAVRSTDEVVTAGFISRRELIESFTTESYGPRLADATSEQVSRLLVGLGERDADPTQLVVLEQPVTASAIAVGSTVRVEVWSVLVLAAPGTGPGRQVWHTVTLDMVLIDGRWLVDGWTSSQGPTPALPAEITLDDATEIGVRLGWERVEVTG